MYGVMIDDSSGIIIFIVLHCDGFHNDVVTK